MKFWAFVYIVFVCHGWFPKTMYRSNACRALYKQDFFKEKSLCLSFRKLLRGSFLSSHAAVNLPPSIWTQRTLQKEVSQGYKSIHRKWSIAFFGDYFSPLSISALQQMKLPHAHTCASVWVGWLAAGSGNVSAGRAASRAQIWCLGFLGSR